MSSDPRDSDDETKEDTKPGTIAVPDDVFPRLPDESDEEFQRRLQKFIG